MIFKKNTLHRLVKHLFLKNMNFGNGNFSTKNDWCGFIWSMFQKWKLRSFLLYPFHTLFFVLLSLFWFWKEFSHDLRTIRCTIVIMLIFDESICSFLSNFIDAEILKWNGIICINSQFIELKLCGKQIIKERCPIEIFKFPWHAHGQYYLYTPPIPKKNLRHLDWWLYIVLRPFRKILHFIYVYFTISGEELHNLRSMPCADNL